MMDRGQSCDIAVVGAGPAGLASAIALRQAGRDTLCIGPAAQPGMPDRRTTALLAGSVTFLQTLGLWQRLKDHAAPLRALRIIDRTGRLFRAPDMVFDAGEIGQEAFGYNISNESLTAILLDALGSDNLVASAVTAIAAANDAMRLDLAEGRSLSARLIVGADGRNSLCRESAGIGARRWTYEQTAVVANFRHSRPHEGACTELHFAAGPFTVVPLQGEASSLVWVERPTKARQLAELADDAFAAAIASRLEGMLGETLSVSARGAFPLCGLVATRMTGRRIALAGEAAHVLPPIGAQGLNLGFRDVAALMRCLGALGDPGAADGLAAYESARRADVLTRTFAADMLNRSLISSLLPMQMARGLGLAGLALLPPLRRAAMRQGMSA